MILKFNFLTPGRGDEEEEDDVRLYSKQDYRDKQSGKAVAGQEPDRLRAAAILRCVGGCDNVETIGNCQTRLRLVVKDPTQIQDDKALKQAGALGVMRSGKNLQVVVGLSAPMVREYFEQEYNKGPQAAPDATIPATAA